MKLDEAPRLPKLPFIITDIALLVFAWLIAALHSNPLSPVPLVAITCCVVLGVAVFIIPYIANYADDQDKTAKAMRQELAEQFKRLITASEHLQHATVQLKSIEEASAKSVATAEGLPYRLQEKIADFNQQLIEAGAKEKAMIEQELTRLRSSESERLSKIAGQIAQSLADGAKVAADTRQQFSESVTREKELFEQQLAKMRAAENDRLAAGADGVTKALANWVRIELEAREKFSNEMNREKVLFEQQLAGVRSTNNDRLAAAVDEVTKALGECAKLGLDARRQLSATAELEGKLTGLLAAVDTRIASLEAAVDAAAKTAEGLQTAPPAPSIVLPVSPAPGAAEPVVAGPEPTAPVVEPPPPAIAAAVPVFEATPVVPPDYQPFLEQSAPIAEPAEPAQPLPATVSESPAATEPAPAVVTVAASEPAPVPAPAPSPETIPVPASASATDAEPGPESEPPPPAPVLAPGEESAPANPATPELDEPEEPEPLTAPTDAAAPAALPKPRKPRAPRKPKSEGSAPAEPAAESASGADSESPIVQPPPDELISEPVVDEPPAPENFSQVPPEEIKPAANRSADGRTRLTVTSYIGIGNKLHLRGEGPGLSPTKGVPLQFVSIGRWRWETDKATEPVICRIYKNDRLEAPIGVLTLLPGTENEVSAQF